MSDKASSQKDTGGSPAGILLVDDEPNILSALKRSLRKTRWKVHTAAGGEEGLQILGRERVQVVVSDYRMNGMDGVAFLSRVKEKWPDVQRVMLTGQADMGAIERAINESEVFRFLNKPWSDSQLAATVTECLEHLRLIESNRRYEAELAERNRELVAVNLELEERVRERTSALVQAEKMAALGRMAGGVAHEINNPLGGILAFAQVLLRDGPECDPQTRDSLETIESCAQRCKKIVNNLLSFSRKSSGEKHRELQINRVVEDALAIARLHPKAKGVELRCELAPDLPPVLGRAGLLEQVVVNLLQNAYQASPQDQAVILRTRRGETDLLVEVEDRGAGVSEEVRAQIFEPFFTTKGTGEGTGLGLFICYGIAQEHGGSLETESREGQGAKFTLRLPLAATLPEKE